MTVIAALHEGLLIRHAWAGTLSDGRETACLLATIAPECGVARSADACPADILPPWMAAIVPWMSDSGTDGAWRGMVVQFAGALHRWAGSTPEDWERRHRLTRAVIVREAMRHTTTSPSVRAICEKVASTLGAGQWPDAELRKAAAAASGAADAAATRAAAGATNAAAWAAARAAWAASNAAADATAARAAAYAARAAAYATRAADRMTAAVLALA